MEGNICHECQHSFITCLCKSCLKCGTAFMKYFRTNFIKGRSHCRVCTSPVCVSCVISIKGYQKVCTRCQIKEKEDKLNTEKAILAVSEAKFGLVSAQTSSLTNIKTDDQKKEAFFSASKKGLDHILMTLISSGCDVNYKDSNFNTPLHYASQGGFIAAAALLIEKGADIKATNNIGWTALHFVASKGSSDHHIECAKFLIEMGLDVLIENNIGETAASIGDRYGAKLEMIQLLKAAEVEVAMEELSDKSKSLIEGSIDPEEKRLGRAILTLLNYVSLLSDPENNSKSSSNFSSSFRSDFSSSGNKEEEEVEESFSESDGDAIFVERYAHKTVKPISIGKEHFSRTRCVVDRAVSPIEEGLRGFMLDAQHNQDLENLIHKKKEWDERCQNLLSTLADTNMVFETSHDGKEEWMGICKELMDESASFKLDLGTSLFQKTEWEERCEELLGSISISNNKYDSIVREKDEWEGRCRKMMTTIADASKEHKKQLDNIKEEHGIYKIDKEDELAKHDAAYVNKLNKQKQEYEDIKSELQENLDESESARQDLLVLQKNLKLSWVPDEFVTECQQPTCRQLFSVTGRKHHCRCCGRVFCLKCSQRKVELPSLGYTKAVRVCDTCYARANTMLTGKVT